MIFGIYLHALHYSQNGILNVADYNVKHEGINTDMDFFGVVNLFGGLALFLYGMHVMGDSLAKLAGGRLEKILERLTSNPIKGVLLGAGVTAVIQSSSATTVMVVGFVNSGIMKLSQAVSIIMGANIGTTITSWILSLIGVESSNFWIQLLKPAVFSPILAVIGVIFLLFLKDEKKHDIGVILLGFAVLMFGMETMSSAVEPLADVPEFTGILTMFSNPLLGMLAGMILTAIIQSSSASVGIVQALCTTGSISYGVVLPIIMGQNIGTCVTALLSSVGAKKNAKRAAFVHLYFNVIGTALFMIVFYLLDSFIHFSFISQSASAAGIAVIHSVFNITATVCLLPFSKLLEKLAIATVRDSENDAKETRDDYLKLLDIRFLDKPAFAVAQSVTVAKHMADLSKEALFKAVDMFYSYDSKKAEEVIATENRIDTYQDELGTYIIKLSSKELSLIDSRTVAVIRQCMGDFERISDHAINITETASYMKKKNLYFSENALNELKIYTDALKEIVGMTTEAFNSGDLQLAYKIEPLEQVIDSLHAKLKKRHIKRLQNGECNVEMGVSLEDIITNYERVADHCSNIAVCMIQISEDAFETHEYLDIMKHGNDITFNIMYNEYKEKYAIKGVH